MQFGPQVVRATMCTCGLVHRVPLWTLRAPSQSMSVRLQARPAATSILAASAHARSPAGMVDTPQPALQHDQSAVAAVGRWLLVSCRCPLS